MTSLLPIFVIRGAVQFRQLQEGSCRKRNLTRTGWYSDQLSWVSADPTLLGVTKLETKHRLLLLWRKYYIFQCVNLTQSFITFLPVTPTLRWLILSFYTERIFVCCLEAQQKQIPGLKEFPPQIKFKKLALQSQILQNR